MGVNGRQSLLRSSGKISLSVTHFISAEIVVALVLKTMPRKYLPGSLIMQLADATAVGLGSLAAWTVILVY